MIYHFKDGQNISWEQWTLACPQLAWLVMQDHGITIRDIGSEVRTLIGSMQSILIDSLCMHHVAAKFLLRLLPPNLKENCLCIAHGMLEYNNVRSDLMKKIITQGDTGYYGYCLKIKTYITEKWYYFISQLWRIFLCQKECTICRNAKMILTVFFQPPKYNSSYECAPKSQTFNKEYYLTCFTSLTRCC